MNRGLKQMRFYLLRPYKYVMTLEYCVSTNGREFAVMTSWLEVPIDSNYNRTFDTQEASVKGKLRQYIALRGVT